MWRIALPPFGNHMLSLIKDTALISVIGLNETLFVAKQAIATTDKPFTMYIFVGLIYSGVFVDLHHAHASWRSRNTASARPWRRRYDLRSLR